jgi:hypothetical protein
MRIAAEVEKVDVIPNKNKPLEKLTEKELFNEYAMFSSCYILLL